MKKLLWLFIVSMIAVFSLMCCKAEAEEKDVGITTKAKIAFQSYDGVNQEIYIMNVDGSSQLNLTNDPILSLSPDGSKIASESNRDGNDVIYIMNVDGSRQVK